MKYILAFLVAITLLNTACQTSDKTNSKAISAAKVDTTGSYKLVDELCEKHLTAMSKFDTVTLAQILADKVQYIGTDPSEMWCKAQIITYMHNAAKPSRPPLEIALTNRSINFLSDSSALVTEHLINGSLSKKIQSRITYQVSKTSGTWSIHYVCWSLAPKNEDLKAIDRAVKVLKI